MRSIPTCEVAHLLLVLVAGSLLVGCTDSQSRPSTAHQAEPEAVGSADKIAFTEVTQRAGLGDFQHDNGRFGKKWFPEQMGAGGGFVDYNGDGWLDLLLVGGGVWPGRAAREVRALRMYQNNGDGAFTEVTREVGLAGLRAYSIGIAAADYDNDGDQDLYLTTLRRNRLYRNDGGTFTEVGQQAGVADQSIWSSSAIFFDADRDGHLDLYVGGYADWSPETDVYCSQGGEKVYCRPAQYSGIEGVYYHNNGDGTFTNRTKEAGFSPAHGKSLGVAELDYNRDGWPDLVVVNDGEGDLLYENNGDGTFTEKGVASGIAYGEHGAARAGMGVAAGVVDSSGQVSVFVGNFASEMIGVYRHVGNGLFLDRAAVSKIGYPSLMTLTFGVFLFDVEYDGDLDLLAANGHVYPEQTRLKEGITYRQPAQLFLNHGDGTFEEANEKGKGGALQQRMIARGAAYGDYDCDGDLDVLLTENNGPVHLWRNDLDLAKASYLRVHLEGRASNRDAIGTRVVAAVDGLKMRRRVHTGSSYLSQSEQVASFGLGGAKQVDTLSVYWPSGRVDRFENVPADQNVYLVEGEGALEPAKRLAQGRGENRE